MTPTQLRAFAAVVRLGSVKQAAAELAVSEAAVSLNVGQLRKEFEDPLFTRTGAGLAFTPGGLRLASRANEMLGLADRIVREVSQAGRGRRLLRVAASSLFAEHAAPGLIPLFAGRADDLEVELSVCAPKHFLRLLETREVDLAIGPRPGGLPDYVLRKPFLKYQVAIVVGPDHPLGRVVTHPAQLREQTWLLGPSAVGPDGVIPGLLRRLEVAEANQRIFQSHAAALDETKRGNGVSLALSFPIAADLAEGRLIQPKGTGFHVDGTWCTMTLPDHSVPPAASELTRFIATPRATHAMLKGAGVEIGHFRPAVHVTLWN